MLASLLLESKLAAKIDYSNEFNPDEWTLYTQIDLAEIPEEFNILIPEFLMLLTQYSGALQELEIYRVLAAILTVLLVVSLVFFWRKKASMKNIAKNK